MNIHNTEYIGSLGLYPIEEIITNTSNNLIYYNINTSNTLINYTNTTSNNLINYTSNNLLLTSNNLINFINNQSSNISYNFKQIVENDNKNAIVYGDDRIYFKIKDNEYKFRMNSKGNPEILLKYEPTDDIRYVLIQQKYGEDGVWIPIRDTYMFNLWRDLQEQVDAFTGNSFKLFDTEGVKSFGLALAGGALAGVAGAVGESIINKAVADGIDFEQSSNSDRLYLNYLLYGLVETANNNSNNIRITSNYAVDTSNQLSNRITTTSNNLATSITTTSNNLVSLIDTSKTTINTYIDDRWKKTGTMLYYNDGTVSIGTTATLNGYKFQVMGESYFEDDIRLQNGKAMLNKLTVGTTNLDANNTVQILGNSKFEGNVNLGTIQTPVLLNVEGDIFADEINCTSLYADDADIDNTKIRQELKVCDPTFYTSNDYIRGIGRTELSNPNSIDEYAILNPLLKSLTKRIIFEPDYLGNIKTKELISNTTITYSHTSYNALLQKYVGSVFNSIGTLYIYDDWIRTYPLDTESTSFSFWCYMPNNFASVAYGQYGSCIIFRIDQFPLNILNNQRPRIRIIFFKNNLGNAIQGNSYRYTLSVQYTTDDTNNSWFEACGYILANTTSANDTNPFSTPKFYSFNLTKTSATIFINGVQVATNSFSPTPNVEYRLEKFYFPRLQNNTNPNENPYNQAYSFWNIYMNYNRLYTTNELSSLYRFETDTLSNTLKVNGIIRTTALATNTLYMNDKPITLPSSYNEKSLFYQAPENNKVAAQDKANNRRSLSIDTVEINTTSNLINNTGNAGYLFYANNNEDTIAQIKSISYTELTDKPTLFSGSYNDLTNKPTLFSGSYNDLTNKPESFPPSSHQHPMTDITGLSSEFVNSSNYTLRTSNEISTRISGLNLSSQWTTNSGYISYNNIQVYPSEIRINNPNGVVIPSYLWYKFQQGLLVLDSSGNDRTLTNNGGTYALDSNRNSIVLATGTDATIPSANWSTFNDLSISGWFKANNLSDGDKLLEFGYSYQAEPAFVSDTTNLYFWYKFDTTDFIKNFGNTGTTYNLTNANNIQPYTTDKVRGDACVNFTNANNNVLVCPTYNFATNFTAACSICFWIRRTGLDTVFDVITYGVLNGVYGNNYNFTIQRNNNNSTYYYSLFGSGSVAPTTGFSDYTADNVWTHYIWTAEKQANNSVKVSVYKNGSSTPVYTNTSGTWSAPNNGFSLNYNAGARFIGNLDDFRVYNRALTATEINQLYTYSETRLNSINIQKVSTDLVFRVNSTPIYTIPSFANNTWTHILWNIVNSASVNGFVRLSTTSIGAENTYTEVIPLSGTYTNKLGSITNVSSVNISDFRILTIPLTTTIKSELYSPSPTYTTLVDDAYITGLNINQKFIDTSNYVLNTSNVISNRISSLSVSSDWNSITNKPATIVNIDQRFIDTSNYVLNTSNTISNRITNLNIDQRFIDTSNYVLNTSNVISNRISGIDTTLSGKQNTITGGASSITSSDLTINRALVSTASGKVGVSAITSTELGYLTGLTENISTSLGNKQNTITGGATTITSTNLTANRALVSDASGKVGVSAITSTELGYLTGLTQNISTSLGQKENTIGILPVSKGGTNKNTITASRLLGCITANQVDEITLGTNLSFSGTTLNATGGTDSRWTTSGNNVYLTNTAGNVGIGTNSVSYRLQVEDGSLFIGDVAYTGSTTLGTANGYILLFDNTFNGTAGSGTRANKIRLHSNGTWITGFGIENDALTYHSGTNHNFYSGTTENNNYGNLKLRIGTGKTYYYGNSVGICNTASFAVDNNYMTAGSLTIGSISANFGGGNNWTTNTAGLMMECSDNTEIMIHDSGARLASFMYYEGANNRFYIGRDAGWGVSSVSVSGNLSVSGTLKLNNNTWHQSADNKNRFYFTNNGTTYFGSQGGYVWRDSADNDDMYLDATGDLSLSGRMGIGTASTNVLYQLYVNGGIGCKGITVIDGNAIELQRTTGLKYRIYVDPDEGDYDETNLRFQIWDLGPSVWATVAYIEDDTGWGAQMNFTGQHRCITDNKDLYTSNYVGYIVSATGKYKNINSKYGANNIKQNIEVNDALPIVELSTKAYDKACFGVVSLIEDDSKYKTGNIVSVMRNRDKGDERIFVNGLGEGSIWVCNYNGVLCNGDYITTSPIAGVGMRQDDDVLHSYTVAKITMGCDFNPQLVPIEVIKQEQYVVYGTSNLTSNIEYIVISSSNIDSSNLEYTSNICSSNLVYTSNICSSNLVYTSNICSSNIEYTIQTSNVMTSNVLDSNGLPIYEYKLDESSNIVYDYEYEVKTVEYEGIEYKMAFVGCVYKCS